MSFHRFAPDKQLEPLIESYWLVSDDDTTPRQQKIVPDGFTEIIFHLSDPYRIRLHNEWELQTESLLAGQIRKHFFLENTGRSDIVGIKLKPTALTHLFGLDMHQFTDKVVDLSSVLGNPFFETGKILRETKDFSEKVNFLNIYFKELLSANPFLEAAADRAVDIIFSKHGMLPVSAISGAVGIGERQLENLFKKYIGLSPKFYARVIRFSYIFTLVQENKQNWSGIAYDASFFDQSHFIRNFKDFTGENPSDYSFDEKNLANFFLQKK
jgi:AraC-like DNA-binding protein